MTNKQYYDLLDKLAVLKAVLNGKKISLMSVIDLCIENNNTKSVKKLQIQLEEIQTLLDIINK